MPKIGKKEKTVKLGEIEKITEYLEKYDTVAVVENTEIQTACIQALRTSLDGKVVFTKKSNLQRTYPSLCYDQSFFLVFINSSEIEKIKTFNFVSFLEAGDMVSEDVIIPAGLIKNTKLHQFLKPLENKGANTYLKADFTVARAGEPLDEKAAKILKIQGERLIQKPINILDIIEAKSIKGLKE